MSPLNLEIYSPNRTWIKVAEIRRGDLPGSISDNKSDGSRDVYMFGCLPDDSKSAARILAAKNTPIEIINTKAIFLLIFLTLQ